MTMNRTWGVKCISHMRASSVVEEKALPAANAGAPKMSLGAAALEVVLDSMAVRPTADSAGGAASSNFCLERAACRAAFLPLVVGCVVEAAAAEGEVPAPAPAAAEEEEAAAPAAPAAAAAEEEEDARSMEELLDDTLGVAVSEAGEVEDRGPGAAAPPPPSPPSLTPTAAATAAARAPKLAGSEEVVLMEVSRDEVEELGD